MLDTAETGLPDDDLPGDLALSATLGLLGEDALTDAKVVVYRVDEKTKKDAYLYDCSPAEFVENGQSEIQNTYGPGEYRVRVYSPGRGVLTHRRLTIGAPRVPLKAPETAASSVDIVSILAQQQAMFMAGIKELAATMRPAQSGIGVAETIQLIASLQSLQQPQARQADPLEMVSKIIALQRDLAPPATNVNGEIDSGAVIMKAIDAFGKPLAEMMSRQQTAPAMQLSAPQVMPDPAQEVLPAPNATPETGDDEMSLKMQLAKNMILHAAKADADPYVYANNLLDFMGDDEADKFLNAPNWKEQLLQMMPEATDVLPWVEKVRGVAVELLKGDEESASVTPSDNSAIVP